MPNFAYEAMNASGKTQKGTIDAATSDEAIRKLREEGLYPTAVREQKAGGATKPNVAADGGAKKKKKGFTISIGGVPLKRMTLFTRQLSTLQDAGLPLLRSLQILEQQQKPGKLKNILEGVCEDVESGNSLSDAFAKYPKAFDRLYVKMVKAGEIGGVLDVILQRLADFMEKGERLKRRIKGALIYPACVISIAIAIVTGIMYFVIPKFQEIFKDFGVKLPAPTVFLIDSSKWIAGSASKDQAVPGVVWVMIAPLATALLVPGYSIAQRSTTAREISAKPRPRSAKVITSSSARRYGDSGCTRRAASRTMTRGSFSTKPRLTQPATNTAPSTPSA